MKFNRQVWLRIAIIVSWAIVQVLLFYKNGIVTEGEPPKYIEEAGTFAQTGHFSSPNFWLYATQIFLILLSTKLKLGFAFVIIVQIFFSLWATLAFYRLGRHFFTTGTALICTALLLLNYPLQEFNTFLQTESLFYSFTLLLSAYVLRLQQLTLKSGAAISLLLILICFTRPTGLLFLPAVAVYVFFHFFKSIAFWRKMAVQVIAIVVFFFALNMALGSGGELDFMLPFRDERIICGVPTLPAFVEIDTAGNGNSLYGLLYYITHNWSQFVKMALLRSQAFFGLTRTYYSSGHNIFLATLFYPVYLVVIISMPRWFRKNIHVFVYMVLLILLNYITVIMTCDDWHNRFFLTISPYLFLLGAPCIDALLQKFRTNTTR